LEKTYKIVRFHKDGSDQKILKRGLSLQEAQEHCKDDETASNTCSTIESLEYTRKHGEWFDAFVGEQ
jgi:hypothetical protein